MWAALLALIGGATAASIVIRVMIALGIGYVTFEGLDLLFTKMDNEIAQLLGQVSADVYTMLQRMGVVDGIKVYMSCFAIAGTVITVNKIAWTVTKKV